MSLHNFAADAVSFQTSHLIFQKPQIFTNLSVFNRAQWEDPYAGRGTDTFVLSEDGDQLSHISVLHYKETGKHCSFRTVYSRHQGSRV